ncbi:MAG: N-acetyltransferase family protein [Pirellulales bacterium]
MPKALRRRFGRLRQVLLQHGWMAAARLAADRAGKLLMGLEVSQMFWLDRSSLPAADGPHADLEFGFLTLEEIEHFQKDPRNSLAPEFVERARDCHDLCFAAAADGRLANFAWYALNGIVGGRCAPITLSTPTNVAYMYNAFTHPDYRGQRLHGLATELAMDKLQELGIDSLVMLVDWTNQPSLRSYRRLGGRPIGRLITVGWGRCKWTFLPCAACRLGIRFGRHAKVGRVVPCRGEKLLAS